MKNILLFAGHNTSKRGGMTDFVGDFDSIYAAQKFIEKEDTQFLLLDTLPSLQWAQIYSSEESKIILNGKVEIWDKNDIGNTDDEETTFVWSPTDDEKDLQPLLAQAIFENDKRKAEADAIAAKEAAEAAKTTDIEDSLASTTIRVTPFDLALIGGAIVDDIEANIEVAFNLDSMKQEGEIHKRHVKVLTVSFSDDDKNYLESIGGPGAPKHWAKQVQSLSDDDFMKFFKNSVLTFDELNSEEFTIEV